MISSIDIYTYLLDRVGQLRNINLTPQHGSLPNPAFAEGKFLFRVTNPVIAAPPADTQPPVIAPPQVAVVAPPNVKSSEETGFLKEVRDPCGGGTVSVSLSSRPSGAFVRGRGTLAQAEGHLQGMRQWAADDRPAGRDLHDGVAGALV